MKLNDGAVNGTYRVVAIEGLELPVERRLEAIGLTSGTNVTILNKKKKGAVIVNVRGT
ncbi:MAG: ferrous iron transport protein A, partial [Peptococcaceae bacterium]|nr:ferrous iron transport protein A [Peptococcaceae bacterium]